jgi:hypothetical protein
MGSWCDFFVRILRDEELVEFRAQLVQLTAELARSADLPFATGTEQALVRMFDDTIAKALARGEDWKANEAFLLSRMRMIGREANRRASAAGEAELTPANLKASWLFEIARTHRRMFERSAA